MKFGLFIPQGWRMDLVGIDPAQHWGVMAGLARRADANDDWTSIWVYDHFHTVPRPSEEATHEAWTLMAAFAAVTGRVRLGQMCTCMGYRNPAYLAKVAATVDIISEGRLEMGIGAGWYEHEWRAYGYGFPTRRRAARRAREGVEIFRDMWTDGLGHASPGSTTRSTARICAPAAAAGHVAPGSEANGIPMWIAGGGEKKTLRIAAQYADYTNFDGTPEGFDAQERDPQGALRRRSAATSSEIVRSANYNVVIGRDRERRRGPARLDPRPLPRGPALPEAKADEQVAGSRERPGSSAPPSRSSRSSRRWRRPGMTYAITYFAEAAYDTTGIALFEQEVHARARRPGGARAPLAPRPTPA